MNTCITRFFLCCCALLFATACEDELSEADRLQKICQAGGCDGGGTIDGAGDSVADVSYTEVSTDVATDTSSDFDTDFDIEADLSLPDSTEDVADSEEDELSLPEVPDQTDIAEDVDVLDVDDMSDTSEDSDVAEDTTDVVVDIDLGFNIDLDEPEVPEVPEILEDLPDTTPDTEEDELSLPEVPEDTQIVDIDASDQEVDVEEGGVVDIVDLLEDVFEETEDDIDELAEAGTDTSFDVNSDTESDVDTEADLSFTDIAEELPDTEEDEQSLPDVPDETDIAEDVDVLDVDDMSDTSEDSDVAEDTTDVAVDIDLGADTGSDIPTEVDVSIDAIVDIGTELPDADGSDDSVDAFADVEDDTQSDASETTDDVGIPPPKCLSNEGCEDGNNCTDNTCIPETGCVSLPNQATCTDNNACTENDLCKESVCITGKPPVCDDGNPCTVDYCDPTVGCMHVNVPSPCNDNNACTENDTCQGSVCVGTPKNCDDGNACTEDVCSGGNCAAVGIPTGYLCGKDSLCKVGVCTAVPVPSNKVLVPAGEYWMGCNSALDTSCQPDESPAKKVFVSAFLMHKYEVRNEDYVSCYLQHGCVGTLPEKAGCSWFAGDNKDLSVNCLTWNQADALCKWAGMRLPTEAEWQKAARGGCDKYPAKDCQTSMALYPWGNEAPTCAHAVFGACGAEQPVNNYTPLNGVSPYGLHHMAGNAAEWLADWYGEYPLDQTTDPTGPVSGTKKVVAGGYFLSSSALIRTSSRGSELPGTWKSAIGARCVQTVTF